MKARDDVFYLFNTGYHVLLRLLVGHLFKVEFKSIVVVECPALGHRCYTLSLYKGLWDGRYECCMNEV